LLQKVSPFSKTTGLRSKATVLFDKYVEEEEDVEADSKKRLEDRLKYLVVYKEACTPAVEEKYANDPRYEFFK